MTCTIRTVCQVAIAATVAIVAIAPSAKAEDYRGWDYARSSIKNGTHGTQIGGSTNPFEFYSMAMKDMGDRMVVAINANLDPNGGESEIAYGDMLFDFTSKGLKGASESNSLFGVKFTTLNSDSGVSEMGIYSGVRAKSVALENHGFSNLEKRAKRLSTYSTESMTELDNLGDLQATDAYFDGMRQGRNVVLNSINTGTRTGNISLMTGAQLGSMGLNFGHFGETGSQTFGFSFLKPKGFDGKFTSTLFAECVNDGIVLIGNTGKSVPEPFALAGLAIVGGALARKRRTARA